MTRQETLQPFRDAGIKVFNDIYLLYFFAGNPGPIGTAAKEGIVNNTPAATLGVDRLEKLGLLERTRGTKNRKTITVIATTKGTKLAT